MESAHSIRFLYQHFLAVITEKSLNTFYHACSYAKADYSRFMNVTAKMALHLIPEQLKSQPVFLCIDDTIISKFGTKFENVSKLFDHATHNGCNYLNGHCFVSLMLCVPVWNRDKISYLAVPLGYRMWHRKRIKAWACCIHGTSCHAWIFITQKCYHTLWQLVYKAESCIHCQRVSKPWSHWKCQSRFYHLWSFMILIVLYTVQ